MHAYWPWWLGGAALATIGLVHLKLLGRTLGVSSSWRRIADWRLEQEREREEATFAADPSQFDAALLAATAAEFGSEAVDAATSAPPPPATPAPSPAMPPSAILRRPWTVDLVFLLAVGVGGLLVAWLGGAPLQIHWTLGPEFERLFGGGAAGWAVLVGGGLLVGVGTRMAGGCTSGHGLTGTARLEPPSIVATAAFFGSGVLLSLLLEALS